MKVFVIEDNEGDYRLLKEYLKELDIIQVPWSKTLDEAIPKIKQEEDVQLVFLDINLPGSYGRETIDRVYELFSADKELCDIPVVIVTGVEDYGVGSAAVKKGYKDFLIKQDLDAKSLERAINYATYNRTMPKRSIIANYFRPKKKF